MNVCGQRVFFKGGRHSRSTGYMRARPPEGSAVGLKGLVCDRAEQQRHNGLP